MADIPADLAATLDPNLPVALLPIRLETRFGTREHVADDGTTVEVPVLRIRVYPDDISVVAAPPGIRRVLDAHPGTRIFTAALDPKLDRNGFIVPGLGDAGDRMFGV